jgi:transposase
VFAHDERCQRLTKVEGVGPLVATALVAAVGNANEFKSGRELSAWLGLVPRQHSSGNRNVLLGISKRGDRYLRTLLIHGARSDSSRSNSLRRCHSDATGDAGQFAVQVFVRRNNPAFTLGKIGLDLMSPSGLQKRTP